MPLDQVAQFADDRGQLVLLFLSLGLTFLSRVDRLSHPSDLDLLNDHHQEQGEEIDDEQKRPELKTKPVWSIVVHRGGCSIMVLESHLSLCWRGHVAVEMVQVGSPGREPAIISP
jgi:hypothetical protein